MRTVGDLLAEARVLLQDTVPPYRYDTASLVGALNTGLVELKRVRPDFFLSLGPLRQPVPQYTVPQDEAVQLPVPGMAMLPLLMFMVGYVQLRDAEGDSLARAAQFIQSSLAALTRAP